MNNKEPVRFIVSCFGDKYIGLLLANLYSIKTNSPQSRISVFWQDIDPIKIKPVIDAFSSVDFVKTEFDFKNDEVQRISSKTLIWELAAQKIKDRYICFLDTDTLLLKSIDHFFDNDEFDVIFTTKKEFIPLNSGVLLCKNSDKIKLFFTKWKKETAKILNDKNLINQAVNTNSPYGGADQMSLYQILNFSSSINQYNVLINNSSLVFKPYPCETLNHTFRNIIKNNTHIVHYKGRWQSLLLDNYMPIKKEFKKYVIFMKTYENALSFVNSQNKTSFPHEFFNIKKPLFFKYWQYPPFYYGDRIITGIKNEFLKIRKIKNH